MKYAKQLIVQRGKMKCFFDARLLKNVFSYKIMVSPPAIWRQPVF